MAEKQFEFSINDIDASPLKSNIQPEDDKYSKINLDSLARLQEIAEKNFQLREEVHGLRSQLITKVELDGLIKPYAGRAFNFMCSYCGFVGMVLILQGFNICRFQLADAVMQFLVGSTAVTVIGLVGMALTGVFVGAGKN